MRHNKVIVTTLMMPPWESFQGRETGEWKRDICAFIRTRRRRKEDKPASFFWIGPKNIFCVPLGLLHNGDYATSYSRNVSIPAAHQNTDFSRQGMYVWIIWPTIYVYIYICIYSWCVGAWWGVVTLWKLSSGSMTPVTSGPVAEKHNKTLRD